MNPSANEYPSPITSLFARIKDETLLLIETNAKLQIMNSRLPTMNSASLCLIPFEIRGPFTTVKRSA